MVGLHTTQLVKEIQSNAESDWRQKNIATFGVDLSFAEVRESERTRHVHRLHPYLGKFIPQLVDVFLRKYFKKDEWVLDPFVGSGTTLVEANLLDLNSVGVELSEFSYLIAKVKTQKYDLALLEKEIKDILLKTRRYSALLQKNQSTLNSLPKFETSDYFKKWYSDRAAQEIYFYKSLIPNYEYQDVLKIILSRAARSARQIPHYDLARPQKPIKQRYWCIKHKQYCEPINEALKFINRYSWDTIKRIKEFDGLRTEKDIVLLQGDSKKIHLPVSEINGVFTSPPYLGLIDYHDQHRYAYELFEFGEYKEKEIGSANNVKYNSNAVKQYVDGIQAVFNNMSKYLRDEAKIFVVVNDKKNLYAKLASDCGFEIKDVFHRPVLFRTERDNYAFSESIYYFEKT